MEWTDISITVAKRDADTAEAIATMVANGGIYIEDYSDLEQQAWEIAHVDLIEQDLLDKPRDIVIVHMYLAPDENPAEVLPLFEQSGLPLVVELKAERGNHDALAAATCAMLDKYKVLYCIESFDPRCIRWLKKNRPEIVRGQLSENFLRHGDGGDMPKALLWALGNLLTNCLAKPDFIAYRFSDRDNFCLRWCRWFYHVQEINWTIITKEEMRAAESAGNLVIFQDFDPRL